MEIIAKGVDAETITTGDLIAAELVYVKQDCGVYEAMQYMRGKGVRRLPVVDEAGGLVGLVTLDDLLSLLAEELSSLSKLIENQQNIESNRRN